jgi:predicted RNA-binding Zn-ribbon protein involved in translation (DUF1610 family)
MPESLLHRVREWINSATGRWVAIGAAVLAVGGAAAVFLGGTGGDERDEIRSGKQSVVYYCPACGEGGQARVGWDEKFPLKCPRCGRQQAVRGRPCPRCGNIIEKKNEPRYLCPNCQFVFDRRAVKRGPAPAPAKP